MDIQSIDKAMVYNQERFTKQMLFQKGGTNIFVLNFTPGQELPAHTHPGFDVYVTVLDGSGTLIIDHEEYLIQKHNVIHCNGDERFSFRNDGKENVSLLVHLIKLPSQE